MKGLNDYIKENSQSQSDFKKSKRLLEDAGYSLELIQKDLKQYSTVLTEEVSYSAKNEAYFELVMSKYGQVYHRFYFDTAENILKNIVIGLRNIPDTPHFDSPEFKLYQQMQDAKARASGFKDSADMTRAYYEK